MIVKKTITTNCTQYCFAWVFYLLYMLHSNLSRVYCYQFYVVLCLIVVGSPFVLLQFFLYCCYLMRICCTVWALLFFILDAGLLARSQYSEVPATGHLDTGFSWFPCVYKQMLRWFPRCQVATTCFSCSPPELNLVVTNFIFCIHVK